MCKQRIDFAMDDHLDPPRMAAWRMLLEAHRGLIDRLEAELQAEKGLALTWYDVLVNLSEAESGRLRMTELAERVVLSQSGLSRLVDRMVQTGLVTRERCDTDRRGTWVVMTERGTQVLQDAAPLHLRGVQEHFGAQLTDEEAEVVGRALAKVSAAVARPSHCPPA
jgi:DNA-binding MarR family transcriptional regulator